MFFHTLPIKGRGLSAYGLFAAHPEEFAAILEDPSGEGRQFLVSRQGERCSLDRFAIDAEAYFRDLRERLRPRHRALPAIHCLFYAAYEAGRLFEESLPPPLAPPPVSIFWAFFPAWSICFAPRDAKIHLSAISEEHLRHALRMLEEACSRSLSEHIEVPLESIAATNGNQYKKSVENVREYIAAGDIFQANIARFWRTPFAENDLLALYDRLRRVNPAPFSGFLRVESERGCMHILSASPERLFRLHPDGVIETRPIAGTRGRAVGEQDDALKAELLLSEKERAEHIMLVDLERNDLGRVCAPGTVEVNECMAIERYATVQHIVSNVRGRLRAGADIVDVFRAMFPGGTITGCPKIRCMQIIHEQERRPRGPYTGGIGYLAWDGSADFNILIRSFWHHDGQLHWAAGAGIVADSDPDQELLETEYKVNGLMRALFPGDEARECGQAAS